MIDSRMGFFRDTTMTSSLYLQDHVERRGIREGMRPCARLYEYLKSLNAKIYCGKRH